jgi:hypothetical protein
MLKTDESKFNIKLFKNIVDLPEHNNYINQYYYKHFNFLQITRCINNEKYGISFIKHEK